MLLSRYTRCHFRGYKDNLQDRQGRPEEALEYLQEAISIRRAAEEEAGEPDGDIAVLLNNAALAQAALGRREAAVAAVREAAAALRLSLGPGHPQTLQAEQFVAEVSRQAGTDNQVSPSPTLQRARTSGT